MSEAPAGPRPSVALAAALALVATAHSPAMQAPLAWDDHQLVAAGALTRSLSPAEHLRRPFELGPGRYYRPVTTLSYALDLSWGGARPGPFHATNLVLHLAVVALLFALARRAGAGTVAAAVAAALFGCLPRLTESVDWVSGRTDLLAALFGLAALLLHRPEAGALPRRLLAASALLLGLLAKEVALAAFVALAAGEWAAARAGGAPGRALRNLAPASAAVALYLALRLAVLGGASLDAGGVRLGAGERALAAVQALGRYLAMLLDPLRPRLRIGQLGVVEPAFVALGAAAVLALAALGLRAWRRPPGRELATALALALAALAPVLHAIPIAVSAVAADRFLYLPAAGLALAAAPVLTRLARRRAGLATAGAALLLLAFAVATYARALDWTDERRLWEVQARHDPTDAFPAHQLGMLELEAGRTEEALAHLQRAAALAPPHLFPSSLSDLAAVLSDLGRQEEARAAMRQSLALSGGTDGYHNLALIELRDLRFAEAEAALGRLRSGRHSAAAARALESVIADARRGFADLPPERPGEPPATRALRARFFERMGLPGVAARHWALVAARSDVPADLLEAGTRLGAAGDLAGARAALASARRNGASEEAARRLTDDLAAAARAAAPGPAPAP